MKILVTGFDPFGGETVNPAYEAVKLLPDEISGARIFKMEIPTVYGKAGEAVAEGIKSYVPDVVLCIGQAGGRPGITVERVAINLAEARIPDNAGNQPVDQMIEEDGENAYFANVPVKAMVSAIRSHGIPASVSYTAGTFVCNDVMYHLLYLIAKTSPGLRGGFIHVPYAPEQIASKGTEAATMSVEMISQGIRYAVEAIIENEQDTKVSMGTIS